MKINKYLIAAAAVAVFSAGVFSYNAAYAISDDLTLQAVVVESLQIECTTGETPLYFGVIDHGASGGTVEVTTAGGATFGGTTVNVGGSTPTAGTCTVTGGDNLAYNVDIPASTVDFGANSMVVNNFTVNDGSGELAATAYNATLNGTGDGALTIGGDLIVGATQVAGTYTGTVAVTVLYD